MDLDARVHVAAFNFLAEQTRLRGEVLPRTLLARGFPFEGKQVRLIGPQGIFKPAILPELPLTITTVPTVEGQARPYEGACAVDCWSWEPIPLPDRHLRHTWHMAQVTGAIFGVNYCTVTA